MSVQQTQSKPDLVQKYGLWVGVAMMIFGMIPASIFLIYSGGEGIKLGVTSLILCAGVAGGILSYRYGGD
jgi:hypothetical protein